MSIVGIVRFMIDRVFGHDVMIKEYEVCNIIKFIVVNFNIKVINVDI